jgi:hypothetical protein
MDCTVKDLGSKQEIILSVYDKIRREVGARSSILFRRTAEPLVDAAAVISLAANSDVTVILDLTDAKETAYRQIDKAANACDAKYTTTGGQMAAIYRGKLAQCDKWVLDGMPADVSPPGYGYIRAEMKRLAELGQAATAADAATAMQSVGLQWEDTLAELREEFRGVGKAKVFNAVDATAIDTVTAEAIASLQAL